MKHTSGPWELLPGGFDETLGYYEPSVQSQMNEHTGLRQEIATIRIGLAETAANAYLIASAPDLLEACKAALEELREVDSPEEYAVCQKLKAAIAKAEAAGLEAQ